MKKYLKYLLSFSAFFPTTLIATSCSNDDTFYMANYESYISDELLDQLDSQEVIADFSYRTYSTNEDLERSFDKDYDIAIPSLYLAAKYANQGKLLLIDWNQFGLNILDKYGISTNTLIQKASDALSLFTPEVRNELNAYNLDQAYAISRSEGLEPDENAGLLNYCVPYFIQSVVLGNNASSINLFNNSNQYSWNTIMQNLNVAIENNDVKRIATVDDYATMYNIARLIETNNATVNPGNPTSASVLEPYSGDLTEKEVDTTFAKMFNNVPKKNAFLFNSDSNILLNDFANNNSQAIISYNGDLLFAMQGGDDNSSSTNESSFLEWIKKQFNNDELYLQTIIPQNTMTVMDCLVINKDRTIKKNHVDKAYTVIKKIALEGADHSLYELNETSASEIQNRVYNTLESEADNPIFAVDDQDSYIYGPMINFDYVNYTSPLLTINAYVLNSASDFTKFQNAENDNSTNSSLGTVYDSLSENEMGNGYFTDLYVSYLQDANNPDPDIQFFNQTQYDNYINLLIDTYNINPSLNINYLATNLSDMAKDNISWAWWKIKNSL